MNIEMENQSILKMIDLYFEEINFKQKRKSIGKIELRIDHKINSFINNDNKNIFKVEIETSIFEASGEMQLSLKLIGIFEIKDSDIDKHKVLIEKNTVAIMMPYLRSQISLVTSQPGLSPIKMPIINVNELLANKK